MDTETLAPRSEFQHHAGPRIMGSYTATHCYHLLFTPDQEEREGVTPQTTAMLPLILQIKSEKPDGFETCGRGRQYSSSLFSSLPSIL